MAQQKSTSTQNLQVALGSPSQLTKPRIAPGITPVPGSHLNCSLHMILDQIFYCFLLLVAADATQWMQSTPVLKQEHLWGAHPASGEAERAGRQGGGIQLAGEM